MDQQRLILFPRPPNIKLFQLYYSTHVFKDMASIKTPAPWTLWHKVIQWFWPCAPFKQEKKLFKLLRIVINLKFFAQPQASQILNAPRTNNR